MYTHTHTIMPLFFMAYFTSSIPVMPIPSSSSESRFSSCHPHDRESARTCQEMKVLVYRSSDIRVGVRETEGREGGREREREGEGERRKGWGGGRDTHTDREESQMFVHIERHDGKQREKSGQLTVSTSSSDRSCWSSIKSSFL